jgi:hypothetical protein
MPSGDSLSSLFDHLTRRGRLRKEAMRRMQVARAEADEQARRHQTGRYRPAGFDYGQPLRPATPSDVERALPAKASATQRAASVPAPAPVPSVIERVVAGRRAATAHKEAPRVGAVEQTLVRGVLRRRANQTVTKAFFGKD